MTSPEISTNSRPKRRFPLPAAVVALALAGVVAAVPTYASASGKVDGVRAAVKRGTLNVTGSDGGQQVALRLKAGDASMYTLSLHVALPITIRSGCLKSWIAAPSRRNS